MSTCYWFAARMARLCPSNDAKIPRLSMFIMYNFDEVRLAGEDHEIFAHFDCRRS